MSIPRSTLLIAIALISILLPTPLVGFTQTIDYLEKGGQVIDIEVVNLTINNIVVFRVFRLNKIIFITFNSDLMLDLGDEVYMVNVKKYGVSFNDIDRAHGASLDLFNHIIRAEIERIEKDITGSYYRELERRRRLAELNNKVIEVLRSAGIDEVHILRDAAKVTYGPTYSEIAFSTIGKKCPTAKAESYIAAIRGLAALASSYQDLVVITERFVAEPRLLCLSDFNPYSSSYRECEKAYGKLSQVPCYMYVGVGLASFWGPYIVFDKACVEELAITQGRSVDDVTNEIIEKTKTIIREIRKVDPALTRVVIWIEDPALVKPVQLPIILEPEMVEEPDTASNTWSMSRIDVIKRNITIDELDSVFEGGQLSSVAATQSTKVNARETADRMMLTILTYMIVAIPIAVATIPIFKMR